MRTWPARPSGYEPDGWNLSGAQYVGASITGATLTGANLSNLVTSTSRWVCGPVGKDLTGTNFTGDDFQNTKTGDGDECGVRCNLVATKLTTWWSRPPGDRHRSVRRSARRA